MWLETSRLFFPFDTFLWTEINRRIQRKLHALQSALIADFLNHLAHIFLKNHLLLFVRNGWKYSKYWLRGGNKGFRWKHHLCDLKFLRINMAWPSTQVAEILGWENFEKHEVLITAMYNWPLHSHCRHLRGGRRNRHLRSYLHLYLPFSLQICWFLLWHKQWDQNHLWILSSFLMARFKPLLCKKEKREYHDLATLPGP